ncbi:MAG: HNH endonuclease [Desulfamplus sp.]|nr:HNH endonuclease [Desulfamplus sp.]
MFSKKCPECKKILLKDVFVDSQGNKNPRGKYCVDCKEKKDRELCERHFNGLLYAEKEYMKKYQIMFGDTWKTKAPPNIFLLTLFMELHSCPYCGKSFKIDQNSKDYFKIRDEYHIDHMNPLNLGGEDSLLNAVCVCKNCNLKKSDQHFDVWLKTLSNQQRVIAEKIYIEKLGYPPIQFVPSEPTPRSSGLRYELLLDIEDIIKMKNNGQIY